VVTDRKLRSGYKSAAEACTCEAAILNRGYRGAGRPEACYLLERLMDMAADELGIDPAELRRHNFIAADGVPCETQAFASPN
jgi:carbon-monoxide dehydrogenase large subunit